VTIKARINDFGTYLVLMHGKRKEPNSVSDWLFLGVDGGGTRCRARLSNASGKVLGEAESGPANIRLGLEQSFSAVLDAAGQCLDRARLSLATRSRIVACLALAGASEPASLEAARARSHPFHKALITTDAHAACVGAHRGRDGGVVVAGTGTVGWAVLGDRSFRVGGWGLPISDEGSGAWLGCEALRRTLWAHDGRIAWTGLLEELFAEFGGDPHELLSWAAAASPRAFGAFAPAIVRHAERADQNAVDLLAAAAGHIEALAGRLIAIGADRIALVGGLAPFLKPRLSAATKRHIVQPAGDSLQGALTLAMKSLDAAVDFPQMRNAKQR
jgi:glucosamine kinase